MLVSGTLFLFIYLICLCCKLRRHLYHLSGFTEDQQKGVLHLITFLFFIYFVFPMSFFILVSSSSVLMSTMQQAIFLLCLFFNCYELLILHHSYEAAHKCHKLRTRRNFRGYSDISEQISKILFCWKGVYLSNGHV